MADTDVLIVGGGPAGLAAALALRRRGVARVLVVDREADAGGIPRHSDHIGFGVRDLRRLLRGPQYAARYVRLAQDAGVEIRTGATATDWAGPRALSITSAAGLDEIHAQAVLLATGCRERPRPARLVPGTRPLGVLTTGALQQSVYVQHAPVGRRAVVVGAEHVSFSAVLTLAHAGASIAAMITEHPRQQSYALVKWLTTAPRRVPIFTTARVSQILGGRRVEAVEVTDLPTGAVEQLACDTVVFTGDWIPDHELARRGGLLMDAGTRAPRVDLALRTSAPGVFAAGNLLHGAEAADVAALSGRHAARAIDEFLRSSEWPTRAPLPLRCAPPIRWVSPSAIDRHATPPHGHFLLRVDEFRQSTDVLVLQGDHEIWRRTYRRLVPNRSIHVAAAWLSRLALDGPEPILRLSE